MSKLGLDGVGVDLDVESSFLSFSSLNSLQYISKIHAMSAHY